ncbi:MAG TPA: hypothetical protein VF128_13035 [Gemmatimonadaceae bacterium]
MIGIQQLVLTLLVVVAPTTAASQRPTLIQRAEAEIWTRLRERAARLGTLMLDGSDLDVRIPLDGEPEEVIGVSRLTNTSRVVGTARLEPLDSIGARNDAFRFGRYDLRIEDRAGNCLLVHQAVSIDTALVRGARTTENCRPLYMAEVVRRSRRLARLPLTAGQLTDNWSVAPATMASVDVYLDSVVVMATTLALRVNLKAGDTTGVQVDSVTVGLALGDGSWTIVHKSPALVVDTVLRRGATWTRSQHRFVIAIDSTFELGRSWPVVEVSLSAPKTESNPYGLAWTYAHGPKGYFRMIKWNSSQHD